MTNEQATKHLTAKLECLTRSKGFREKCDTYNSYEGCYECDLAYKQGNIGEQIENLKMAIKALEQEPCEDAISREQAKSAIRDRFKDLPSRVEINTILNDLPSVTPSYNSIKTELKSCEDCISRQAVLDCLKATKLKQSKKFDLIIEIRNEVMMLPPVVLKSKSDVLDKIIAKIEDYKSSSDNAISEDELTIEGMKEAYTKCIKIINECKSESEE